MPATERPLPTTANDRPYSVMPKSVSNSTMLTFLLSSRMARLARQLVSLRYGALLFCLTAVPVRGLPGQQKETTLPTPSQDPAPSSHARIVAMRLVSDDESIALASPVQIPLKPGDLL